MERLQAIILNVVQKHDHRREFLRYCRAAANVDDERFRDELGALEQSDDPQVSQRANWVLAGLDGKWLISIGPLVARLLPLISRRRDSAPCSASIRFPPLFRPIAQAGDAPASGRPEDLGKT